METGGFRRFIHYPRVVRANSFSSTKGTSNAIARRSSCSFRVSSFPAPSSHHRREIMHDLRRYVPLMELKCAKRHVKSGVAFTAPRQFAHRSVRIACDCSRDKGSRIREPEVDVEVVSTGACAISGSQSLSLFRLCRLLFVCPIAIGIDGTTLSIEFSSIFRQYISTISTLSVRKNQFLLGRSSGDHGDV